MILETRYKIFFGISIALILIGLYFIAQGGSSFLRLYDLENTKVCDETLACFFNGYEFDVFDKNGTYKGHVGGAMSFQSDGIFSVYNPVKFWISLKADPPEFAKSVYMLIVINNNDNYTLLDNQNFDDVSPFMFTYVQTVTPLSFCCNTPIRAFPLSSGVNGSFGIVNQTLFTISGNLSFRGMVVDENNIVHIGPKFGPIFNIADYKSKVEADDSRSATIQSRTIYALTWFIVGTPFLILGGDFLARIYLRD